MRHRSKRYVTENRQDVSFQKILALKNGVLSQMKPRAAVFGLVLATLVPALALTKTTTWGKVCGHRCPQRRLETFGGYIFKGTTKPSRQGQIVRFAYKRPWEKRWHRFGRRRSQKAFERLTWGKPIARVNAYHRWRIFFAPYRTGRWVLRAKFIRQDGYASSSVKRRVRVIYSD